MKIYYKFLVGKLSSEDSSEESTTSIRVVIYAEERKLIRVVSVYENRQILYDGNGPVGITEIMENWLRDILSRR